jgi:hypothetical protein
MRYIHRYNFKKIRYFFLIITRDAKVSLQMSEAIAQER